MLVKQSVHLGPVEETMLIPLYARAVESRRKNPILHDPMALQIVESIDWDFARFGDRRRTFGCSLRSAMFDKWARQFLQAHPDGTIVEVGAGLNTRYERLDNGRLHWFDLDLPAIAELRRTFFTDSARRATLACSILDPAWIDSVRRAPAPYFFVAETVFVYLPEEQVRAALSLIARHFPGATLAFDTVGRKAIERGNRDFARHHLDARFVWACEDPRSLESWNLGLRLLEARTAVEVPDSLLPRLTRFTRTFFALLRRLFPKQMKVYQFCLFRADGKLA